MKTCLAAAALVVVVLGFPASAAATFPGANGKIAFERDGDIWTINPDGSGQVNITNTPSSLESAPAWSADGTQIAYARAETTQFGVPLSGIWAMAANGAGQHQLVAPPSDTNVCGPPPSTYLGSNYDGPSWSPDGATVAFHYFARCNFDTDYFYDDLYTVKPDGTGKTLLKQGGRGPRWSPDGSKVGYTGVCGGGGCYDVRWVTADGSSDFIVHQEDFLENDLFLDWSPDGLLLDAKGERFEGVESYTIHPDGTGYTVLPNGVGRWSPDGTKFVQDGVYTMNVDGSNRTQIATSGTQPDWQPITTNYARPKGATPIDVFLVPAYGPCVAPNRTHGSPLAFPSCAPPNQTSAFLTVGTPDANVQAPKSIAAVRYRVKATAPADLLIDVQISDVRKKSDLSDYTGELQLNTPFRITDRFNGPAGNEPATLQNVLIPASFSCAATADTTVGSSCNVNTSINSILAGAVVGGKRAIWQAISEATVNDGGSDGQIATSPNTLFLRQGIFIP